MGVQTIVHLLRHGEVHNPEGILYGRMDGFHLSDLGHQMAQRIAESIGDRDIVHLRTSPLERAQETLAPPPKSMPWNLLPDSITRGSTCGVIPSRAASGARVSCARSSGDVRRWTMSRSPIDFAIRWAIW